MNLPNHMTVIAAQNVASKAGLTLEEVCNLPPEQKENVLERGSMSTEELMTEIRRRMMWPWWKKAWWWAWYGWW